MVHMFRVQIIWFAGDTKEYTDRETHATRWAIDRPTLNVAFRPLPSGVYVDNRERIPARARHQSTKTDDCKRNWRPALYSRRRRSSNTPPADRATIRGVKPQFYVLLVRFRMQRLTIRSTNFRDFIRQEVSVFLKQYATEVKTRRDFSSDYFTNFID